MREMICLCSAEGVTQAHAKRVEAARRLGCTASGLHVRVWRSLHEDFDAEVGVASDQWFGVSVRAPGESTVTDSVQWVECDHPLDGLVHHWLRLSQRDGGGAPSTSLAETQAESARLVTLLADADLAWEAHKGVCEGCVEYRSPCEEGEAKFTARGELAKSVENLWGYFPWSDHEKWGWDADTAPSDEPPANA